MLHTIFRGNLSAAKTIVFLHGWPDTDALFSKQYPAFEQDYRIVSMVLPNYTKEAPFPQGTGLLGTPLDTLADLFIATVKSTCGATPPLLVAHDWGAIVAYLALSKEPRLVARLVALDIGQHSSPTLKGIFILCAYQWTLIASYFMPSLIGNCLTRLVARLFKAPGAAVAHAGMNYLYVQVWRMLLTGTAKPLQKWDPPKVPILYLYGLNKPLFFHSQRWLQFVSSQPEATGGKVVAYPGGHWFFTGRQATNVNEEIIKFFAHL